MAGRRYNQPTKITDKDFLHTIASLIGLGIAGLSGLIPFRQSTNFVSPLAENQMIRATPTPTPIPYEEIIKSGFEKYGNPPAAKYTPYFAEAIKKYPVIEKNPYLLPALSIVETSGGKNITYPENLFNWGKQKMPSVPYVIDRVAKGISEDPRYAKFRETGRIEDLARIYAPQRENPNFLKNLIWALNLFQQK